MKKKSKLKNKINTLKKTTKGKATLRLIKWCIFFVLLFLFLLISSLFKPSPKTPIEEEPASPTSSSPSEYIPEDTLNIATFNNALKTLTSSPYNYNYEITVNDTNYIYKGTQEGEATTGYKETNMGITKYYRDSTGSYSLNMDSKVPYPDLYAGLDTNYLDLNYLKNTFQGLTFTLNSNHNCSNYLYESTINDINYQIEFDHNTYHLVFININTPNATYHLNFN